MGCISQFRWIGIAAVGLIAPGCLYLPHCSPMFRHTPAIRIPAPCNEAHAFRVDGTRETTYSGGCCARGGFEETLRLNRLHPSARGRIGQQWVVGVEFGDAWYSFGGCTTRSTEATLGLVLYRSGFETIQMKADDEPRALEWKPVADIAGYEKAVDDLLGDRNSVSFSWNSHRISPAPGRTSPEHREALLFCAGEYERIARKILRDEPDREESHMRLIRKAKSLRELAERNPESDGGS